MVAAKKSKILIIDEDPVNTMVLEEMLGKDHELSFASTEQDAVEMFRALRPDLIFLDITVQGSKGYDICRKLKSNPSFQFTKIILMSSKAMLKDRLYGYQAGADDYLPKPFDRDELLAKVKVFLRLKSVEEVDRVKDDLINVFSHETRTPLNAIIGFSKLLIETAPPGAEQREYAGIILESGISLLNLSNKTVLLSNLKKGGMTLNTIRTTPSELLEGALGKMTPSLKAKKIKLRREVERSVVLSVDLGLIGAALAYILDNAWKHSPEGGSVTVRSFKNAETGDYHIAVRDSGDGIPPERLGGLFDEFGVEDVGHHGRGHGLSLAIVKYIMEAHDGAVTAESAGDGTGAVFSLIFPGGAACPLSG
jgi:signal transduction histidine kinase